MLSNLIQIHCHKKRQNAPSVQVPGDTQIGKVLQLDKGGALSSIHGVAGCTEHNANPILGSSSRIDAGLGILHILSLNIFAVSKQKGSKRSVKDDFDVVQPKGIDADKVRVGYLSDSELPSRQRDGPITGFELCKLLSFRNFRCPCHAHCVKLESQVCLSLLYKLGELSLSLLRNLLNWILWNIRGISDRGSFARLKALIHEYIPSSPFGRASLILWLLF